MSLNITKMKTQINNEIHWSIYQYRFSVVVIIVIVVDFVSKHFM